MAPTPRRGSAVSPRSSSIFGSSSPLPLADASPEARALRWLETSATRPRRHNAPERHAQRGHYHHAHLDILTPEHARRQYQLIMQDMTAKDPEWLEDMPLLGATTASFQDHPLTREQERAARRLLCVVGYTCEMDFCPLLLDLVPLLLTILPEHVAYGVVRNMHLYRPFYFGTGHRHFLAVMAAFRDYLHKYFPETAGRMAMLGADTEEWLGPIFYRCFVPLLGHKDLVRLLDLYLEDGLCFFFRLGMALFKELKWRLKAMRLDSPALWWDQLADFTCSLDFDAEHGLEAVLANYGSRVKRSNLERIVALRMSDPLERELIVKQDIEPLQLHGLSSQQQQQQQQQRQQQQSSLDGEATVVRSGMLMPLPERHDTPPAPLILQNRRTYLKLLASFLPPSMRQRGLRCCYSSERHGRSLETLYRMCHRAHPAFFVIEEAKHGHVIGAYCPEPIHPSKAVSGTGACFLFRLSRPAVRYEWARDPVRALDADVFQLATHQFFAVGSGGGSDHPGLKVDLELETGSSHACPTFGNLPLCGRGQEVFRIQRIEVYHLPEGVHGLTR